MEGTGPPRLPGGRQRRPLRREFAWPVDLDHFSDRSQHRLDRTGASAGAKPRTGGGGDAAGPPPIALSAPRHPPRQRTRVHKPPPYQLVPRRRHQISRSRPFHKNDNAHVEQKNWTLVRRLIGYQRLDTPRQLSWLDEFYTELLRPYNNCFQPVMKLVGKEHRADAQPRKRYDTPTTPLQRVLASGLADLSKVKTLVELYSSVSPLTLKRQIDVRLAAMPLSRRLAANA